MLADLRLANDLQTGGEENSKGQNKPLNIYNMVK